MRSHGLRTGLFTSPHFVDIRERVLIDGVKLDPEAWTDLANRVDALAGDLGMTYFEWLFALAVLAFEEAGVEAAVFEAGLGGTYDAVNSMESDLAVFTPIGLDHESILGDTVAEIARDKAGIMRTGGLAVSGRQSPEAMEELDARARETGTRFLLAEDLLAERGLSLGEARPALLGPHQRDNARLAIAAYVLLSQRKTLPSCPRPARRPSATHFFPAECSAYPESRNSFWTEPTTAWGWKPSPGRWRPSPFNHLRSSSPA